MGAISRPFWYLLKQRRLSDQPHANESNPQLRRHASHAPSPCTALPPPPLPHSFMQSAPLRPRRLRCARTASALRPRPLHLPPLCPPCHHGHILTQLVLRGSDPGLTMKNLRRLVMLSALSHVHAFGSMPVQPEPGSGPDPCDRCPSETCLSQSVDLLKEECSGCTACHGLCEVERACVTFYGDFPERVASDCRNGFTFRASHQGYGIDDSKFDCVSFSMSDAECTAHQGGEVYAAFQST
jgi:hypothetical protein